MRSHLFAALLLHGTVRYTGPDLDGTAIRIPPQPEPDVLPYRDPVLEVRRTLASIGPAAMKLGPRLLTNDAEAQGKLARAKAKRARRAAKRLGVGRG